LRDNLQSIEGCTSSESSKETQFYIIENKLIERLCNFIIEYK